MRGLRYPMLSKVTQGSSWFPKIIIALSLLKACMQFQELASSSLKYIYVFPRRWTEKSCNSAAYIKW